MTKNKLTKSEISMIEDLFNCKLHKHVDPRYEDFYGFLNNLYFEVKKSDENVYKLYCGFKRVFNSVQKKLRKSNQYLIFSLEEDCSLFRYNVEFGLINKLNNINI